ncbi:kinesin-3-like isoform X3 [Solanum tuberosum]|nr:PREDICTED: kinesin-3-like isoform X3 [Solanum tuberosum]
MVEMGLPRFHASDLEQGSMKIVLESLLTLREEFKLNDGGYNSSTVLSSKYGADASRRWKLLGENLGCGDFSYIEEFSSRTHSTSSLGERMKTGSDSKFQRALRSPVVTEPSAALIHHVGHKFHEVFQLKQGSYTEIPAARISEMMRSNSLDIAPTQSLLSVVNGILDESVERKNGEIPQRVACLLRKVVQEIERRISTQAEHLRTQSNLFKSREEKYQSRIRIMEVLATGTSEETQIVMNQLHQIKNEKNKAEEKKKIEEQDVPRLKEKDDQIAALKQELEMAKKSYESKENEDHGQNITALKKELEIVKKSYESKEKEDNKEIIALKQEMEIVKKSYESKENEDNKEITALKKEMEIVKKSYELKGQEALKQELEIVKKSYELKGQEALKQELEIVKKSYELKGQEALKQELEIVKKSYELKGQEALKQELEIVKKSYELKGQEALKQELEIVKKSYESKENEDNKEITALKKEMEIVKKSYELKGQEALKQELEIVKKSYELKGQEALKQELEIVKKSYELKGQEALKQELEIVKKSYELKGQEALKQELEIVKKSYELKGQEALKQELEIVKKSYELKGQEALKQELEIVKKSYELKGQEALKQELEIVKKSYELKGQEALKQELEIVKKSYELKGQEALKQELEIVKKSYESKEKEEHRQEIAALKQELETVKNSYESNEKEDHRREIADLKQEMEIAKKLYEQHTLEMKEKATEAQQELEEKLKEAMSLLTESRNRIKELETFAQSNSHSWKKKEHIYQIFTDFQLGALRELKFSSQSIRQEVVKTQQSYVEEFNQLGAKVRALGHAAANYSALLAENRKLHNEVQELKGNIRVYCRIRPFFRGQKEKQSVVEYIGENGELIIVNPSKQGKEGRRSFKFNKVYNPAATQADVYSDIQPLIQSVLDGYNVCIFAYGQTGSGKTYTMTGPDKATEENWGVNYRALNDIFRISQMRVNTFTYEITVQMMEIYNEQVRDLLSSDGSPRKLGIVSAPQPNGLAVPEASMHTVNKTSDVLNLMDIGLRNRARGSTAMNERSSRSHSVVTIHVRGMDIKSGSSMCSSLHLVDLAGSERVDRSEVTGDRLKEAQHINKSLSALGDVIYALAQKNAHVPFRNSKLTQVLQTSLGGQAKTLMFVQLNPEVGSHSETTSTLKFAERASGVELGAARSSKEGRDVRDLMEQVGSLKETISQKDNEIEKLQLIKDKKYANTGAASETNSTD